MPTCSAPVRVSWLVACSLAIHCAVSEAQLPPATRGAPPPTTRDSREAEEAKALVSLCASREWQSPKVRHAVLTVLAELDLAESRPLLEKFLGSGDDHLTIAALDVIGRLRLTESIPAVTALAKGGPRLVRCKAVDTLARIGGPTAGTAVIERLADPDPDVRRMSAANLPRLRSCIDDEALLGLWRSTDEAVRLAALSAAAQWRSPRATELVRGALRDESPRVRASAAQLIGEYRLRDVGVAAMDVVLRDDSSQVRSAAVRSLPVFPDWLTKSRAEALLGDRDREVRLALVTAVDSAVGEESARLLGLLVHDESAEVRAAAYRSVAKRNTSECSTLLMAGLDDPVGSVAIAALQGVLARPKPQELGVSGRLTALFLRADKVTKCALIDAMKHAAHSTAQPILTAAVRDPDVAVRAAAVRAAREGDGAVAIAILAATDADAAVRREAALVLVGHPEDSNARQALAQLRDDRDRTVAGIARLTTKPSDDGERHEK